MAGNKSKDDEGATENQSARSSQFVSRLHLFRSCVSGRVNLGKGSDLFQIHSLPIEALTLIIVYRLYS